MNDYPTNEPFAGDLTLSPIALLWIAALVEQINTQEARIAALESP